jgi:glycosyltransferase involved in cell wall biosynthesis
MPHRARSNNVSAVVGVSRYILDRHLEYGYFNNVPIKRVIYNARDPQSIRLASVPPARTDGVVRVGFIGRFERVKGLELLLEVFHEINLPNAELWITGACKGDYGAMLQAKASSAKVRFLGHVSPHEFYPLVDFVVVPSLWNENCSMVVIEALAFGRPVISSRQGGTPEIIKDKENGFLFDTNKPNELATAIRSLASDIDLRVRMSVAAANSAELFTNMNKWINQYIEIYSTLAP